MQVSATLFALLFSLSVQAAPYDDIVSQLKTLEKNNSTYVQLIKMGKNDQGVDILGVQIETPNSKSGKIPQLIVGAHHGNEERSVPTTLTFAQQILDILKNSSDPLYPNISESRFFVIPVLNISGYNSSNRYEEANGHTFDPNRDYPDPCGQSKNTYNLKSTKALADYMKSQKIVGAATIHGYQGAFTYPWGTYTSQSHTLDDKVFAEMTAEAAQIDGYQTGTHGDVIYPTVGAFEDWAYLELGVWVTLMEIESNNSYDLDAKTLVHYFATVPNKRSDQHSHLGVCTNKNLPKYLLERSRP